MTCACGKCAPDCLANRGAVTGRCVGCGRLVCELIEIGSRVAGKRTSEGRTYTRSLNELTLTKER